MLVQKRFVQVGLAVIGLCGFAAATASANLLTNGSFETGTYPYNNRNDVNEADLAVGSTTIPGWTVIGGSDIAVIKNGNPYGFIAQDGVVSLDLTGYQDAAPYGGVSQTISTVPGGFYDLTFWLGSNNSEPSNGTKFNGPVSATATAGGTSAIFTNPSLVEGMQWEEFSLPFTASGSTTPISIVGYYTGGGLNISLDNASVVAVPEPMSLGLGVAGGLTLLRRRRVARA